MKKTLLLLALSAIASSSLLVSGCGMFRSHKAWETAKQESPLEIPPSLDRPSTSAALVIPPPGANEQGANSEDQPEAASASGQVSDGFVLKDSVDSTYQRVGRVFERGDLGQVVSHDDTAHSYVVRVSGAAAQAEKRGFFARMFHRKKDAASADASAESNTAANQVQVNVGSNGADGSEVRVQGGAAAVGKVIDGLKSSLGG